MSFWTQLTSEDQLNEIYIDSFNFPQIIFKHSTTCNVSSIAKYRLTQEWDIDYPIHYLDIKSFRKLSKTIEDKYQVMHESPQILIIDKGECIFDESHLDINVHEVKSYLKLPEILN